MRKILINYTAEIPPEDFEKFCKKAGIGIKDATIYIREAAIKAAETEINYVVNQANNM